MIVRESWSRGLRGGYKMHSIRQTLDMTMPDRIDIAPGRLRRFGQKIRNPEGLRKLTQLLSVIVAILTIFGLSASLIIASLEIRIAIGVIAVALAIMSFFVKFNGVDIYTSKK